MSEVIKRYVADDVFREVADLLYGGGADELIYKANPDQADLAARKKKSERTQAKIGLASNIVGLAAGTAGLLDASDSYKKVRKVPKGGYLKEAPRLITGRTKALAAGAVGLQALNLGGDAVANRVLARSAKKDDKVKKDCGMPPPTRNGKLIPTKGDFARYAGGKAEPQVKKGFRKIQEKVKKSDEFDIRWEGEISKVNADKQQVFGWASIVEMDGEPVVDLQGDYIAIDEVEKSAYEYVHTSRKGGDMHLRDGDAPVHASDMIESFVVTPEKKKALGLPESMPTGWWVGYQVNDPELWGKVKNGERTGFSIHGSGMRS